MLFYEDHAKVETQKFPISNIFVWGTFILKEFNQISNLEVHKIFQSNYIFKNTKSQNGDKIVSLYTLAWCSRSSFTASCWAWPAAQIKGVPASLWELTSGPLESKNFSSSIFPALEIRINKSYTSFYKISPHHFNLFYAWLG